MRTKCFRKKTSSECVITCVTATSFGLQNIQQDKIDVYGKSYRNDKSANRATPHYIFSNRYTNRKIVEQRAEFAKYSDSQFRRAFVPQDGWKLMSADYSQIEIFLLAEFSDDKILQNAIINGEDIHAGTAAILFDKQPSEVSKEERMIAKTVNFGILYGQSAFGLANELQISRTQAATFIEKYFENYRGVKNYIETLKDLCRKNGYSSTHWGRHRTIKEINEKNKNIRENGERMAVNSVIQGTAADLIKQAMIRADNEIRKRGLQSRLLLQVHDELIFEVPPQEIEEIKQLVKNAMECDYGFKLPLKTSIETGDTWGEMH